MNSRRTLLAALGAGALSQRMPVFAQAATKIWRVGFLNSRRRPASIMADFNGGFIIGMRELGYVEGKNLVIEYGFADNDPARLPGLANEMVRSKVDVIVGAGTQAIAEAQKATSTIPIVMGVTGDPVGDGFVKTLARPGGNITGTSIMQNDLMPKRLEMLLGIAPGLTRVAVLFNPANSTSVASLASVRAVEQPFRVKVVPVEVRTPQGIEPAFAQMKRDKAGGVLVVPDALLNTHLRPVAELAAKQRLPAIAGLREYAEAGGLMSYGPSYFEIYRRAATYVDKIFKGAKPADLPVEQPTKFELFINGKTAQALGLTIPQSLLISADKVIE